MSAAFDADGRSVCENERAARVKMGLRRRSSRAYLIEEVSKVSRRHDAKEGLTDPQTHP